jgi:subtilisin family serine protease
VKRGFAACALALFAWLALASPAFAQAGTEPAEARQILVMLKLAAPHFRPGSNYGGAYGDAASAKARQRSAASIARRAGLVLIDGWPMPLLGVDCYVMRLPAGADAEAVIARVSKEPMVEWSEPMQFYTALGQSAGKGDPLFAVEPAASAWRLADLHRIATGRGVRVAIVDSKVDTSHPDLSGQFVVDRDFVSAASAAAEMHGTGIAGVIGAKANNGIGIAGVAPEARMMALRACRQSPDGRGPATSCDSLSLAKALQFAIEHDAGIINLSLSGPRNRLLQSLVSLALSRGTNVVAAYDPGLPGGGFPASQNGVIAVADESLQPVPSGLYIAPGRDVPTTQPGGRYYLVNGSSYAAAHVTGLLALARQRRGRAPGPVALARASRGGVDACATLASNSGHCDCRCPSGGQQPAKSH